MGDYSTNAIQEGDVLMHHSEDRGDITELDGFIVMTKSFETMIYFSHFGGNEDDDGSEATKKNQWWGNEGEPEENQYRSRLQAMLDGRPLTSATLPLLADAALEDLERDFVPVLAKSAEVTLVEIISPKHFKIHEQLVLQDDTVIPFVVEG